jgi:branched-chain amino acid transport system ATP-binding protein
MLEITDLDVRYGRKAVLHGVSLTVAKGEIVTLIGSNGAGKTTLLKTISGLLQPASGDIRLEGQSIAGQAPHKIIESGIVHVPEGRLLFPDMSVREHLDLGAIRARPDAPPIAERLTEVFELFPILAERQAQKGGSLSGGQQQMLAFARAMMAAPRFLMLDEPTLGLAPVMIDQLSDAITRLHRSGITLLVVEQRVDLALALADRGYVMQTGSVVMTGDAKTLLADPGIKAAFLGI